MWDGELAGARSVFMKIGTDTLHFYEQPPHDHGCNAISRLGSQVAALDDLYARMAAAGLHMGKPIRDGGGSRYFMLEAPDGVLLELYEPRTGPAAVIHEYFGMPD